MSEFKDDFNEQEFLEKVKKAAEEGAKRGYRSGFGTEILKTIFSKLIIPALAIMAVMMLVLPKVSFTGFSGLFNVNKPVEGYDTTIENHGIFGYTAADFREPVLSDKTKLKKLEVLSYKISDVTKITNAGLFNLEMFSKTKMVTYNGTAVYTVDLSELVMDNITVDNSNRKVYLLIPHAVLEPINIQSQDMEFGDLEKGFLAFGDLKFTVEQIAELQSQAREKMKVKLLEDNIQVEADKFAKQVVWEVYQPVISQVAPNYTLEVMFRY
ncbi:MAG: DUF4230 domain-containing protein [Erysipelotrichaceae bacterium]|nr:DUF4230 domain-containing protein [Erysipelotrichaceae bacterium]